MADDHAPYAYDGLDRVLHEKARLGILTALINRPEGILFTDLKELCRLTDGNLNRHLSVLSDANLVEVWKGTAGPRSQTLARLSPDGRREFSAYLRELERVLADARPRGAARRPKPDLPPGLAPA